MFFVIAEIERKLEQNDCASGSWLSVLSAILTAGHDTTSPALRWSEVAEASGSKLRRA